MTVLAAPMTELATAAQAFLRYQQAQGHHPKTIRNYRSFLGQFLAHLDASGHSGHLADLKGQNLTDWLTVGRQAGNRDHTLKTKAIHIKAFTAWLADEGEYLDHDPCARIKRPKAPLLAKPTLALDQIEHLLAACDTQTTTGRRDRAMLLLMFSTGLRSSEIRALEISNLHDDQGQILLPQTKNGQFRVVPFSHPVERAVTKYLQDPKRRRQKRPVVFLTTTGRPLTENGFRMIFRRLEAKAGVHCNPHKWRHTSAIEYLRAGGKVETLQALLGHQDLTMTLHYARQAGIDITSAHATADPLRRLKRS